MIAKRLPLIVLLLGLALALTISRTEGARPLAALGQPVPAGR